MRIFYLLSVFFLTPNLLLAGALPLSDLLTTADDYWKTSAPQKLSLIDGGKINPAQQYIPVPPSSTSALVGYAAGAAGLGGLAFYQHTGKDPAMALLDGIHHVIQPAWLAFQKNFVSPESYPASAAQSVGAEVAILSKLSDLVEYAKNSASGAYQAFKDLINDNTTDPGQLPLPLSPGDYIRAPDNSTKLLSGQWASMGGGWGIPAQYKDPAQFTSYGSHGNEQYFIGNSGTFMVKAVELASSPGYFSLYTMVLGAAPSGQPPTAVPGDGAVDLAGLSSDLANNPSPQVNTDLAEIIKSLPATQINLAVNVPPGVLSFADLQHPSLSSQNLQEFFTQNAADVYNQAQSIISNPASTPQEIAAAQIAANAAQQTAQQVPEQLEPEPETFGPISDAPFESPYDPGPFDIPARFTTFLSNVKSTGLFSFSSSFFNSLPGGGSPIYTIEAGTYGTHTIDLSETMGTGLAVLKTVLLLLFAFLSIRVVILKRYMNVCLWCHN